METVFGLTRMTKFFLYASLAVFVGSHVHAESQGKTSKMTPSSKMAASKSLKENKTNNSVGTAQQDFEQKLLAEPAGSTTLAFSRLSLKTLPPEKVWARFTKLKNLTLVDCDLVNISSLSGLRTLEVLRLEDNKIFDLSPLADLIDLQELSLSRNKVADITPIGGLQYLKRLYLNDNHKTLFQPLPKEDASAAKKRIDRNNAIIDILKKKGVLVSK
jgi:Leucine-rich repeat (LRR) protein